MCLKRGKRIGHVFFLLHLSPFKVYTKKREKFKSRLKSHLCDIFICLDKERKSLNLHQTDIFSAYILTCPKKPDKFRLLWTFRLRHLEGLPEKNKRNVHFLYELRCAQYISLSKILHIVFVSWCAHALSSWLSLSAAVKNSDIVDQVDFDLSFFLPFFGWNLRSISPILFFTSRNQTRL